MSEPVEMPEAEALVQGYLENSLTEHESSRLRVLLIQEPSAIDQILWGLRADLLIRAVIAEQMATDTGQAVETASVQALQWLEAILKLLRGHAWAAGLAGLSAILMLGLWLSGFFIQAGVPRLAQVEGSGLTLERNGQSISAYEGEQLLAGDLLRTPGVGASTITFAPEKTRLTFLPGSDLKIPTTSHGKRFDLLLGKFEASVARQRPFRPMIVKTPHAEACVLGTKFTLTVSSNTTRLEVSEGKVRFTRLSDGARIKVGKGQYSIAGTNVDLAALPQTGKILYECWTNVPADTVDSFLQLRQDRQRYPNHADKRELLAGFEVSPDQGDNFADRFRGYLHPPATGEYVFTLDTDEDANLLLSPNSASAAAIPVACTSAGQETRLLIHQSVPLLLTAGQVYYIEVTRYGGKGPHHLAIYWQLPDGTREILPGTFLSPLKPEDQKETKP